jgi:hypothetical protein
MRHPIQIFIVLTAFAILVTSSALTSNQALAQSAAEKGAVRCREVVRGPRQAANLGTGQANRGGRTQGG